MHSTTMAAILHWFSAVPRYGFLGSPKRENEKGLGIPQAKARRGKRRDSNPNPNPNPNPTYLGKDNEEERDNYSIVSMNEYNS